MDNLIKEIFQESKEKKKIINIRTYDNEDDSFYCGYILDYNDVVVQIKHFSEYGNDDGISIQKIDNIGNIEFEEDYSAAIQYLIQNNTDLDKSNIPDFKYDFSDNWRYKILSLFLVQKIIIVIENYKLEKICGFVHKLTENELILKPIGKLGEDEGYSLYKLSDINSIQPDDLECRKRLLLYKWKYNINSIN
jgi:hypothetical protein